MNTPKGFSPTKGDSNYWLDAVRDFWADTGLDTDCVNLLVIVKWFDDYREGKKINIGNSLELTNAHINFFEAEIRNEANGGDSPATLGSAVDSLLQAPYDIIIEWCNDDSVHDHQTAIDFVTSVEWYAQRLGRQTELENLLPFGD